MDGIPRAVVTVNGTIPASPIIAYKGQEMVIHVKNHLLTKSITIHWQGLHQRETPFMDGVAYNTQCPIGAGQMFTYKFTVSHLPTRISSVQFFSRIEKFGLFHPAYSHSDPRSLYKSSGS